MRKASHLIGMLGLNEMVEAMTGSQLHESEEAEKLGRAVYSENAQVAFSPEFTICNECSHMERGLLDHCRGGHLHPRLQFPLSVVS
ncbi:MAG: hypothetical protein RR091_09645 [Cloacibacillus sp.]